MAEEPNGASAVKDDGGPAFPHQFESMAGHPNYRQSVGISVRDYFAGQSMQAQISRLEPWAASEGYGVKVVGTRALESRMRGIAKAAYSMADAMLREREKGGA
jgi:hypothetical protein